MSEVHPWDVDEQNPEVSKLVPAGKRRCAINNLGSSKTAVRWFINEQGGRLLERGRETPNVPVEGGDVFRIEAVETGKSARGALAYD